MTFSHDTAVFVSMAFDKEDYILIKKCNCLKDACSLHCTEVAERITK